MLIVPLSPIANQGFSIILANQNCGISVYQKSTGLFIDLSVANAPIVQGAIAVDRARIVRTAYLGFIGDLAFFDTQGVEPPEYTGLGTRWLLAYLEVTDLT